MFGALALAIATCVAIDLFSNVVLESWQLEHLIDRPVIVLSAAILE